MSISGKFIAVQPGKDLVKQANEALKVLPALLARVVPDEAARAAVMDSDAWTRCAVPFEGVVSEYALNAQFDARVEAVAEMVREMVGHDAALNFRCHVAHPVELP